MNEYFLNRKSHRNFIDTDINDTVLKQMLKAAAKAPTTGNMQLYSVVITRDAEKKQALAPAHFSQPAFVNAPVVLTFCADFNRFCHWCRISDADPGYDNIQSFVAAALDAVILAQQFVTVAEMEGYGTCYLGTATYNPDIIAEVLDLPELVVPVASVAVGVPADTTPADTDRLDIDAFVFDETYHSADDEELRKIYSEKENREDSQRFIRENNKQTLAQVFTDVRYPRINNELFSTKFIEFLRRQGFLKQV